jgi:hypothetical protein
MLETGDPPADRRRIGTKSVGGASEVFDARHLEKRPQRIRIDAIHASI